MKTIAPVNRTVCFSLEALFFFEKDKQLGTLKPCDYFRLHYEIL